MKYIIAVLLFTLTVFSFSFSNGIWTYAEDIRAGVFGEREGLNDNDNFTFNNVVYFNRNIFSSSNITVQEDVFAQRFVSLEDSSFFIRPSDTSSLDRIVVNRIFSHGNSNFFLRPAHTSVLESVNITGVLRYRGEDIDERFLRTDGSNSMSADLNLDGNRITNVGSPVNNNDVATREFVETTVSSSSSSLSCVTRTNTGTNTASVSCAPGEIMTGGGCDGGATDHYVASRPQGDNGWYCHNWKVQNRWKTAFARCCTIT